MGAWRVRAVVLTCIVTAGCAGPSAGQRGAPAVAAATPPVVPSESSTTSASQRPTATAQNGSDAVAPTSAAMEQRPPEATDTSAGSMPSAAAAVPSRAHGWQRTEVAVSSQACPEPSPQAEKHPLPLRVTANHVAPHLPVRTCYERVLEREPRAEGRVVVSWTIERDGTVRSPIVVESEVGDEAFRACVGSEFAKMPCFPRPEGGSLPVRYPIMFAPG